MNDDLFGDLWRTPEYPRSFTSEPHRLVMHEDPDDGFGWEVLHPDTCHYEVFSGAEHFLQYRSYDCDVAWHIDAVGIDDSHVHAFDDDPVGRFRSPQRLLPGVYTLWVTIELYRDHENIFGGLDANSLIDVEPQRALTTGRH